MKNSSFNLRKTTKNRAKNKKNRKIFPHIFVYVDFFLYLCRPICIVRKCALMRMHVIVIMK